MKDIVSASICVPENEVYKVQELHLDKRNLENKIKRMEN